MNNIEKIDGNKLSTDEIIFLNYQINVAYLKEFKAKILAKMHVENLKKVEIRFLWDRLTGDDYGSMQLKFMEVWAIDKKIKVSNGSEDLYGYLSEEKLNIDFDQELDIARLFPQDFIIKFTANTKLDKIYLKNHSKRELIESFLLKDHIKTHPEHKKNKL